MKRKTIIIVGVLVIAILIFLWIKNRKSATGATTAGTATGGGASGSTGGTPATTTNTNPVTGQSTQQYTAAGGAEVPTAVTNWAKQGMGPANQAQFFKMLPSMTSSEINQLYDIIINAWGKGVNPTPAQVQFWDTWRVKYHILDGTYNNFNRGGRRKK